MSTKISRSVINFTIEIVFSLNYLYLCIFLKSPTLNHHRHLPLVYTIENSITQCSVDKSKGIILMYVTR